MKCKICDNSKNNIQYRIKEMMNNSQDEFEYFECSNCGCLQISEIPSNMSRYYPQNYYSFSNPTDTSNSIKKFIKHNRNMYALTSHGSLGKLLYSIYPFKHLKTIGESGVNPNSKILDVGCGSGWLLDEFKLAGFKNLTGIDPYINEDINKDDFKILKSSIQKMEGKWDLIMYNHSFEHISDPYKEMQAINKVLDDKGTCIIRIPTVSSFAWETYKTDWVQIDAPRHFFLYSIQSFEILANKCGLEINKIIYDSTLFQFLGSEQYKKGISLLSSENSYYVNPQKSIFSQRDIKKFKGKAAELNNKKNGDQVAIFLRKVLNEY